MRNIFSWLFKLADEPHVDHKAKKLNQTLVENVSARTELTRNLVPELRQNRYRRTTFDLASVLSEMTVVERDNEK
jgi:hypothetical protein